MDRLLATGEDRIDSTTKTYIGNDRMVSKLLALHFTASTIGLNVFSMHKTERGKYSMPFVCFALYRLVTVRDILYWCASLVTIFGLTAVIRSSNLTVSTSEEILSLLSRLKYRLGPSCSKLG